MKVFNLRISFVFIIMIIVFSKNVFAMNETYEGMKTVNVFVNNRFITGDVPAVIMNGRTMVPLKFTSEALGYSASWDSFTGVVYVNSNMFAEKYITGTYEGRKIVTVYVNNKLIIGDVPPVLMNGRTMIPLKHVSEALGATVTWDSATKTVNVITSPSDVMIEGEVPSSNAELLLLLSEAKRLSQANLTEEQIYHYLTRYGRSDEMIKYATENHGKVVENQTKEHAVQRAKEIANFYVTKTQLVNHLYNEGFTLEHSRYGADNCEVVWLDESVLKERNLQGKAISRAMNYLNKNHGSREHIIKMLRFWGYTQEHALLVVDDNYFDWMEQAELRATELSKYFPSNESLIKQLKHEGFTDSQAIHGVNSARLK